MWKKIRLALITKANTVSGGVAIFFKKLSICKFLNIGFKEYDEMSIDDRRKLEAYLEVINMRK